MTDIAAIAREAAEHFEAKLHAYRKTQDGDVISLNVHPKQVPSSVKNDDLGTRYMIAFVRIDDNEEPKVLSGSLRPASSARLADGRSAQDRSDEDSGYTLDAKPAPGSPAYSPARVSRKWEEIPYEEQAGILGNDPDFRDWLKDFLGKKVFGYTDAAMHIRSYCGVDSRKSILPNTLAGNRWNLMVSAFRERSA